MPGKGGAATGPIRIAFAIVRSLPHGQVTATLGTLRRLTLHQCMERIRSRQRDLCEALLLYSLVDLPQGPHVRPRTSWTRQRRETRLAAECVRCAHQQRGALLGATDVLPTKISVAT